MADTEKKVVSERKNPNGENKKNDNNGRNKKRNDYKKKLNKKPQYVPAYAPELLGKSVEDLGLSEQTRDILLNSGIDTLGKICSRTEKEMFGIQFFGKKQLKELSSVLAKLKVEFRPDEKKKEKQNPEQKTENPKNFEKKKTTDDASKTKKEFNAGERNRVDKSQNNVLTNKDDSKEINNRQKNKENSQKKKEKDEPFDVHNLFPKAPFAPSPAIVVKQDPFIKFQRGSKWGFKDKNGKELIPPIYDEVFNFKGDYACVERKQLFGFINRENELIIPYKYEWASSFSEGYACVGNESKCGYITPEDVVVIPFIYDAGTPVVDGKAQVKQNGNWGTLDILTKVVDWGN